MKSLRRNHFGPLCAITLDFMRVMLTDGEENRGGAGEAKDWSLQ